MARALLFSCIHLVFDPPTLARSFFHTPYVQEMGLEFGIYSLEFLFSNFPFSIGLEFFFFLEFPLFIFWDFPPFLSFQKSTNGVLSVIRKH